MTGDKRWELGGDRLCGECSDTGGTREPFYLPNPRLLYSSFFHQASYLSTCFLLIHWKHGAGGLEPSAMEKKPLRHFSCVPSLTLLSKLSADACKQPASFCMKHFLQMKCDGLATAPFSKWAEISLGPHE